MSNQNNQKNAEELRKFGLVTGAMFVGIFGLAFPLYQMIRHGEFLFILWPWIVMAVLGAWALLHPASLAYIYRPWMKFAEWLGWVNTRIILFIVFFLIIFPIGIVLRICGHDAMRRQFNAHLHTYRQNHHALSKSQMEHPY